jgi:hypothetical protein
MMQPHIWNYILAGVCRRISFVKDVETHFRNMIGKKAQTLEYGNWTPWRRLPMPSIARGFRGAFAAVLMDRWGSEYDAWSGQAQWFGS